MKRIFKFTKRFPIKKLEMDYRKEIQSTIDAAWKLSLWGGYYMCVSEINCAVPFISKAYTYLYW